MQCSACIPRPTALEPSSGFNYAGHKFVLRDAFYGSFPVVTSLVQGICQSCGYESIGRHFPLHYIMCVPSLAEYGSGQCGACAIP
ncbi:hypothetical protein PspLS_01127 [Pyricularia sp. CBS 133598]|nr:hypothetical protein PspLS_01127 [Pyricularia sp. CBS 133598]